MDLIQLWHEEKSLRQNKKLGEIGPLDNGSRKLIGGLIGTLDLFEKRTHYRYHWQDLLVG